MIYLDSTLLKLEAILAGAVAANQPEAHVHFREIPSQTKPTFEEYLGATKRTATNGANDVTICAAPGAAGRTRNIDTVSIYNKDTANVTVTVKTDDGTTEFIIRKQLLAPGESLCYEGRESGRGWYVA